MAFIPLYYTESSLDAWTGKDPTRRHIDALTANTDNLDLRLSTASVVNQQQLRLFKILSTSAVNLTGCVAPAAADGLPIFLQNIGAFTITLKNAATSTAANQFNCTGGADIALAAGAYVMMIYEATSAKWTVGLTVPASCFKIMVPGATEGVLLAFDNAFWSAHNTGNYDATGTKTPNTVDVYYRPGNVVPTQSYASSSAATRASIPLEAGRDEIIQVSRANPVQYWIASQALGVTVRFRKNEQGNGLNKQP